MLCKGGVNPASEMIFKIDFFELSPVGGMSVRVVCRVYGKQASNQTDMPPEGTWSTRSVENCKTEKKRPTVTFVMVTSKSRVEKIIYTYHWLNIRSTSAFHVPAAPSPPCNKRWHNRSWLPNFSAAAFITSVTHSCRGRPTRRTYLPTCGCIEEP